MVFIAVPLNTSSASFARWCSCARNFRGKALLSAAIDLPFAVSPVVIGLALILVYGRGGWFGDTLLDNGIQVIFSTPGMVLATIFVSLPFVVREVVPVLREIGTEQEQAAATLGASRSRPSSGSRCRQSAGAWPTAWSSPPRGRSASSAR